jgi:Rap1a immunity proteins
VNLTNYLRAILVGVALTSVPSPSSALTGNELLRKMEAYENAKDRTKDASSVDVGYLMGYVDAATSVFQAVDMLCVPGGVTLGQMTRIIGKYMRENPAVLHEEGHFLVYQALRGPFPCKGKR